MRPAESGRAETMSTWPCAPPLAASSSSSALSGVSQVMPWSGGVTALFVSCAPSCDATNDPSSSADIGLSLQLWQLVLAMAGTEALWSAGRACRSLASVTQSIGDSPELAALVLLADHGPATAPYLVYATRHTSSGPPSAALPLNRPSDTNVVRVLQELERRGADVASAAGTLLRGASHHGHTGVLQRALITGCFASLTAAVTAAVTAQLVNPISAATTSTTSSSTTNTTNTNTSATAATSDHERWPHASSRLPMLLCQRPRRSLASREAGSAKAHGWYAFNLPSSAAKADGNITSTAAAAATAAATSTAGAAASGTPKAIRCSSFPASPSSFEADPDAVASTRTNATAVVSHSTAHDGSYSTSQCGAASAAAAAAAASAAAALHAVRAEARPHLEYGLLAAVLHCHVAVTRQILSYMAWSGVPCAGGAGASRALAGLLEVAAATCCPALAAALVDAGWPVDGAAGDMAPLRAACRSGDEAMVSLLLSRGARVALPPPPLLPALSGSCAAAPPTCPPAPLQRSLSATRVAPAAIPAPPSAPLPPSALMFADSAGMVALLLACRPELYAQAYLDAALVSAAERGDPELVSALLDAGASAATFRRGEALTRAVVVGSGPVVRLLLRRGGGAGLTRGNRGAALLLLARMWQSGEAEQELLQVGVQREFSVEGAGVLTPTQQHGNEEADGEAEKIEQRQVPAAPGRRLWASIWAGSDVVNEGVAGRRVEGMWRMRAVASLSAGASWEAVTAVAAGVSSAFRAYCRAS